MADHEVYPILELARRNEDFRREVVTGATSQVVLMTLQPDEEIGEEVHEHADQSILIVAGEGEAVLDGQSMPANGGDLVFVPAGTLHNVRNTTGERMRIVTVYAPPEHPPGTVHHTKAEADAAEHTHG